MQVSALLSDRRQVLRPVLRDSVLRLLQRHPTGLHLVRKVSLHTVFDFEISVVESGRVRPALWPNIAKSIRAA